MKKLTALLMGAFSALSPQANADEQKGVIGRTYEDKRPVLYKLVNELPDERIRRQLTWLTVISWKYDGTANNGLPPSEINQRMIALEDTIEDRIEQDGVLRHVYSRTGNNLKELVYYIHDREIFLEKFNEALSDHPRYPIEINFYEDEAWEDFQRILKDFS